MRGPRRARRARVPGRRALACSARACVGDGQLLPRQDLASRGWNNAALDAALLASFGRWLAYVGRRRRARRRRRSPSSIEGLLSDDRPRAVRAARMGRRGSASSRGQDEAARVIGAWRLALATPSRAYLMTLRCGAEPPSASGEARASARGAVASGLARPQRRASGEDALAPPQQLMASMPLLRGKPAAEPRRLVGGVGPPASSCTAGACASMPGSMVVLDAMRPRVDECARERPARLVGQRDRRRLPRLRHPGAAVPRRARSRRATTRAPRFAVPRAELGVPARSCWRWSRPGHGGQRVCGNLPGRGAARSAVRAAARRASAGRWGASQASRRCRALDSRSCAWSSRCCAAAPAWAPVNIFGWSRRPTRGSATAR